MERRGVSFLLSFNRSEVRNITRGTSGGNNLGGDCRPRAGTLWNCKRIPWKNPGRVTRQKERGEE